MKKQTKRILRGCSVLCAAVLLVAALAGCQRPASSPAAQSGWLIRPEQTAGIDYRIPQSDFSVQGDHLYAVGFSEETSGAVFYRRKLSEETREVVYAFAAGETAKGTYFGADGTLWVALQRDTGEFDPATNFALTESRILHLNTEGQVLAELPLSDVLATEEYVWDVFLKNDRLLVEVSKNVLDADGMMGYECRFVCLDKSGALQFSLPWGEEGDPKGFLILADGQVAVVTYNDQKLLPLDLEAKAWGEPIDLSSLVTDKKDALQVAESVGDYLFLVQRNTDDVYGYAAESGELVRLFGWEERGVVWNGQNALYQQADGTVVASENGYFVSMTPCLPSEEIQPSKLILAGVGIPKAYVDYAVQFNKMNPAWRLEIKEYKGEGVSAEQAALKLGTEMIGGAVPDILYTGGLSTEDLIRRGILADLYPLIDADAELSRDAFVDGVLQAQEVDGKLYQLAQNFTLTTMAANTDVVGDVDSVDWATADRLLQKSRKYLFQWSFTQEYVMLYLGDISSAAAKSGFENAALVRWLNEAAVLPTADELLTLSAESELIKRSATDELAEGKILFESANIYSPKIMQQLRARLGDRLRLVGYPTENGSVTRIKMNGSLAITAACEDKAGAWAMLKACFNEEVNAAGMSVLESEFRKEVQAAGLSAADEALLRRLVKTAVPSVYGDTQIKEIISAEASYFFGGKCTAEEAAAKIQSRVQVYMNEQY